MLSADVYEQLDVRPPFWFSEISDGVLTTPPSLEYWSQRTLQVEAPIRIPRRSPVPEAPMGRGGGTFGTQ